MPDIKEAPEAKEGIQFYSTREERYTEMLRLDPNGDIFVKGKLATSDLEVVEGLREWLYSTGYLQPDGRQGNRELRGLCFEAADFISGVPFTDEMKLREAGVLIERLRMAGTLVTLRRGRSDA